MRIPERPPKIADLLQEITSRPDGAAKLGKLMLADIGPTVNGRYRHWQTLMFLEPPDGFTNEEWWLCMKLARYKLYRTFPLTDKNGQAFRYAVPDAAWQLLHGIDQDASGTIQALEPVVNPQTRDTYLIRSLIEEAITSSQLEGASTTAGIAKDMILQSRKPRNKSEQMILNNYQAMHFILQIKDQKLTQELILELHKILTENTLDKPDGAGRFRLVTEPTIVVDTHDNKLLHNPPEAMELEERIQRMCAFANEKNPPQFVHPVIRAILLHLWLSYDHPFIDGNGRTARALFYWSMLSQGYWLCEHISISQILKAAPVKYSMAFLYTESDENDATYFIMYQLSVIVRAIAKLQEYLRMKMREIRLIEEIISQSDMLRDALNHRQLDLINHAVKHPNARYTIAYHCQSHNVSYQTARTDLLKLADLNLLTMRRRGREFIFLAPQDLLKRLESLASHPTIRQ